MENIPIKAFGPEYNVEGVSLRKWRTKARKGLKALTRAEVVEYGDAVEKAILAKQRSEFYRRVSNVAVNPHINCASGTNHNSGEAIHEAIKAQHLAGLYSYPAQARRKRTPAQWEQLYVDAMAAKAKAKEAIAA